MNSAIVKSLQILILKCMGLNVIFCTLKINLVNLIPKIKWDISWILLNSSSYRVHYLKALCAKESFDVIFDEVKITKKVEIDYDE